MRWAEQLQLNHYIKERDLVELRVESVAVGWRKRNQCVQSVHTLPLLFPLPEGSPNSLQLADFLSLSFLYAEMSPPGNLSQPPGSNGLLLSLYPLTRVFFLFLFLFALRYVL